MPVPCGDCGITARSDQNFPSPSVLYEPPLPLAPRKDSWLWEGVGRWNEGGSLPLPHPLHPYPHVPKPYRTRAGVAELIKAEFQV